ncbi:MAG: [FeFe] hydrogenase, group A [Firmicutes bacterium]|nr:[FeFe] hydrogenase, group A [Bacillota bacterium]
MKNITLTINGIETTVPENYSVLQAAEGLGLNIPRLCFLKDINETSSCRLCVVDVKNIRGLKNSCTLQVQEGMEVQTDTNEINDSVVQNLQLLASNHIFECWACEREHNCELLDLMRRYNVENIYGENPNFFKKERLINDTSPSIVLDSGKCILCGRCVTACEIQSGLSILDFNERGNETYVGPALFHNMEDSGCIYCGKCIQACPVAAIKEKSEIDQVLEVLRDPSKKVIVSAAPSIRVALGEEFGSKIGENVEGKMYTSFKKAGFDEIMDTNFSADLTILEEGTEFINRVKNNGVLPLFTSCSPGWINYIEQYEPQYLANLSTAKSPQQMAGAVSKHYYAEKLGYKKEDVVFVSIMPCIAKKHEAKRPEMEFEGIRDVDYVLTTREYARLLKRKGIDFMKLEDSEPHGDLAKYTGAGVIFGATGGVMEAALRTVSEVLEGKETPIEFTEVRGLEGIKEATYNVAGIDVNVAVVHGGSSIKEFFAMMKKSKKQYHFVEFMACTGGCINGGGQPIHSAKIQDNVNIREERTKTIYEMDKDKPLRKSHNNPVITKLYSEWIGEPGSHIAHDLLHTHYGKRNYYKD